MYQCIEAPKGATWLRVKETYSGGFTLGDNRAKNMLIAGEVTWTTVSVSHDCCHPEFNRYCTNFSWDLFEIIPEPGVAIVAPTFKFKVGDKLRGSGKGHYYSNPEMAHQFKLIGSDSCFPWNGDVTVKYMKNCDGVNWYTNDLSGNWFNEEGLEYQLSSFIDSDEELLAKAEKDYPVGTRFNSLMGFSFCEVTKSNHRFEGSDIIVDATRPKEDVDSGDTYLYKDGVWATILQESEYESLFINEAKSRYKVGDTITPLVNAPTGFRDTPRVIDSIYFAWGSQVPTVKVVGSSGHVLLCVKGKWAKKESSGLTYNEARIAEVAAKGFVKGAKFIDLVHGLEWIIKGPPTKDHLYPDGQIYIPVEPIKGKSNASARIHKDGVWAKIVPPLQRVAEGYESWHKSTGILPIGLQTAYEVGVDPAFDTKALNQQMARLEKEVFNEEEFNKLPFNQELKVNIKLKNKVKISL